MVPLHPNRSPPHREDREAGFADIEKWNLFNKKRLEYIDKQDFEALMSYASWRTKSDPYDGGNAMLAALEYWNRGVVYTSKGHGRGRETLRREPDGNRGGRMILREAERIAVSGERIAKIASSFSCVPSGTGLRSLERTEGTLPARYRAVVDSDLFVLGIIVPQDLVEILGKPFGRDLLKRQKADDIMRKAVSFRCDEYIEEIQARIAGDLETELDSRYVLVDRNSRFCGHVSSHDILVHALADHRREMETAAAIQNRLVPPCATRRSDRVSITCSAVMAQEIGGDFYYSKEYAAESGSSASATYLKGNVGHHHGRRLGFLYDADFSRPSIRSSHR